jgi:hypothetical protein
MNDHISMIKADHSCDLPLPVFTGSGKMPPVVVKNNDKWRNNNQEYRLFLPVSGMTVISLHYQIKTLCTHVKR